MKSLMPGKSNREPLLMKSKFIACLGWGSLVWRPQSLPICSEWFTDGPLAPVEFRRKSSGKRVTLVIDESGKPVKLLWARMRCRDMDEAVEALRSRERTKMQFIGSWLENGKEPKHILGLAQWASTHKINAVVWTALPPSEQLFPAGNPVAVIEYLKKLEGTERDKAREYVECAPRQIDTDYRREIEASLGWSWKECVKR
jgi:hypothetical protein